MPDPAFLVDTSSTFEAKLRSLRAYESQFVVPEKGRQVLSWLESQDRYLGSRIGASTAEGFWTKEPIGLMGLGELVM